MKKLFCIFLIFLFNCSFKINEIQNKIKDSFGYIYSYIQLVPVYSIINNDGFYGENISSINELLKDYKLVKGSSHIVKNYNKTLLITSNHVCDELFNVNQFDDFKEIIKKNLIQQGLIDFEVLKLFDFKIIYEVKDFYGKSFKISKREKSDKINDLCLISSKVIFGQPVDVNLHKCNWGDEILNISVSNGLYFENAVPIRTGYYSGIIKHESIDVNLYSLKIDSGASGSFVFNKNGDVCGNINFIIKGSDLSFGATNKSILDFLN